MGLIFDKTMAFLEQALPNALDKIGQATVEDLREDLSGSSPSPPGTSPGRDTGNLVQGISYSRDGHTLHFISDRDEGDPNVPGYLEFGTSRMAARPYMQPSMIRLEHTAPEILRENM